MTSTRSWFDRLFLHPRYTSRADIGQMRVIVFTALVLFLLQGIYLIAAPNTIPSLSRFMAGEPLDVITIITTYSAIVLTFVAARLGWTTAAGLGTLGAVIGGLVFINVAGAFRSSFSGVSLIILLVVSSIVLRERGVVIGLVFSIIALLVGIARRDISTITVTAPGVETEIFNMLLIMGGAAMLLYAFMRNTRAAQEEVREVAEDARLRLATVTTDIAQRIASQTSLDDLLTGAVEEIRASYTEIYHAQIFLIDDAGVYARLVASTGEVGALLLARGHRLEVGSVSVIGRVTATGQTVVARAGSGETVHKRNELLPETVVEAAFPLVLNNRVIGALDLQSREVTAFSDDDLPIFQSLAGNIAIAIGNARLYDETQARLRENQRLLDQMRGAMQQIERLNRELTGRSWAEYLEGENAAPDIEFDFTSGSVSRTAAPTPAISAAITSNSTIHSEQDDAAVIAVPVRVRGQVIGAIEFELDPGTPILETAGTLQAVSERFGLALENTRLYETTQRVAQREQRVNAIAAQYQDVTTVDELLRITVSELGALLGAEKASIRLGGLDASGAVIAPVDAPLPRLSSESRPAGGTD
jgi:GAF domain-containing protein